MTNRALKLKQVVSWLLALVGHIQRQSGIPVLVYHSVDDSGSLTSVSPSLFRAQMEYLRDRGYHTIPLQEFLEYVQGEPRDPGGKAVVLTFDDGFKNNYTEAFPVLREYGFTCTIFLPTDYIGRTCDWARDKSIPKLPLLSWQDIRKMSDHGIDFGSHGCSHARLTRLPRDEIRAELLKSKSVMEAKLNKPVTFFCHPYGETNKITQELTKECGYSGAFGGIDFSLTNTKDRLYDLTRVGTAHFSSLQDFRAGVLGTYGCYIRIKQLRSLSRS